MAAGRMYRIEEGRILLGVCGGVAEYFTCASESSHIAPSNKMVQNYK